RLGAAGRGDVSGQTVFWAGCAAGRKIGGEAYWRKPRGATVRSRSVAVGPPHRPRTAARRPLRCVRPLSVRAMTSSGGPQKTDEPVRRSATEEIVAIPLVDQPTAIGGVPPTDAPIARTAPLSVSPGSPDAVLAARGYTKGRLLGSGGCAKVYEATSPGGLPVAIKIIFLT